MIPASTILAYVTKQSSELTCLDQPGIKFKGTIISPYHFSAVVLAGGRSIMSKDQSHENTH